MSYAASPTPYLPHVTADAPTHATLLTRVAVAVAGAAPDPDAVGTSALEAIVAGTRARGAVVTSEGRTVGVVTLTDLFRRVLAVSG